ncbi:multidrug effflux MFS transporter [Glacieibacterium frigidum]|uniref:Bcr/CflA family efflux transporter n=1 Tax=Glacieibacterium frigidum TaxID=2593303 RepID=A0A552UFX8_9SPHN|nr:multidrug effflux MFS transporter [Glacieibacterium frigidum]TRW17114.1 multidrug effflux MFS transporter [Glacieibacterium frigidum]
MQQSAAPVREPKLGEILLLGSLTAFGAVTIDLYLPALPEIGRALDATPARVQLTMSAFFIGMAVGQLIYGPVSDRVGRRPALLFGCAVYVVASLACAFAPTIEWLIAGRFAQALGACCGQVLARAVVGDRYGHVASARILSLLVLVLAVAPMLAPAAGGLLASLVSWRAVFVALAGFGALVGIAVYLRLDESRSDATAAQARAESPLRSYLDLLRNRRLVGYILAGALQGAVLFSYIASAPELIINIWGFSPLAFGWLFPLLAVAVIGGSQVNRHLLTRYQPDDVLKVAALAGIAATVALVVATATGAGIVPMLVALFAVLASYGFMAANTTAGALAVDALRAGTTSALIGASAFAFGAVVATLVGLAHDGTALPMTIAMLICMSGSAAALFGLALPRRVP